MDERVFFHLSELLPDEAKDGSAGGGGSVAENSLGAGPGSSSEAGGAFATAPANSGGVGKPIIRRGQEVAFRIGQRQGKPLGLRVRKLPPGTLPTEESLPGRFVGVVVVPPRNINIGTDKEKVGYLFSSSMFILSFYPPLSLLFPTTLRILPRPLENCHKRYASRSPTLVCGPPTLFFHSGVSPPGVAPSKEK